MPIHPLPVLAEEEEEKARQALQPPKTVVVRYGSMHFIGEFPYSGDQVIGCGTKLIVKTPRGVELGEMLTTTCENSGCGSSVSRKQMLQYIDNSGGKQFPFTTNGRVLRIATVEDLNEWGRVEYEKPSITRVAKAAIKEMDLPMKLVDVEPIFSRERIVFYFSAEDRIDFRELVKKLAAELKVRVEMRQVGSRDEARLVADYEKCGQQCCCKQFLKVLKPVSMRSAKIQKATLDPAKISGRCGRLMCCLRYEDKTYDQLRKNLPHRKTRVMTEDGPGTVISTQILTQLALVELDAGRVRNAYPIEHIEKLTGEAAKMPQKEEPKGENGQRSDRQPSDRSRGGKPRGEGEGGKREGGKREGGGEPRRPKPGKPLRDEEVQSREGEQSDQVDQASAASAASTR
ncbi:MAG: PSP1 domain-containing protein [Planctomycetota bacterium]|jgi:cell fate regulator YaaT (PSP1 superfamily)